MDAIQAMRIMQKASGKTGVQVSADIGRSRTYFGAITSAAKPPQVDTLAAIADACGYDLQLVSRVHGDVIKLEPPQR